MMCEFEASGFLRWTVAAASLTRSVPTRIPRAGTVDEGTYTVSRPDRHAPALADPVLAGRALRTLFTTPPLFGPNQGVSQGR